MAGEQRVISDAEMAAAQRSLEERLDAFGASALRIRDERDQAIYLIDTLIENMRQGTLKLPVSEGNVEAGAFATSIAQLLDYARDQRSRLP